ncbi:MAG TPA: CNNM domain-containing protein, partial [Chthoniobacterales bacterium]|nr:CNNM domain-containing protein [Chthoniobacterales bacterium]
KTMVAWAGCLSMPLLRHHLARFSAKLFAINSSRIPPQHIPPSGAKSGLAVVFLVLLNGFFVASEFAIVKVRSTQLDTLAARGNELARLARHVTST